MRPARFGLYPRGSDIISVKDCVQRNALQSLLRKLRRSIIEPVQIVRTLTAIIRFRRSIDPDTRKIESFRPAIRFIEPIISPKGGSSTARVDHYVSLLRRLQGRNLWLLLTNEDERPTHRREGGAMNQGSLLAGVI